MNRRDFSALLLASGCPALAFAGSWPQWRGPGRDGLVPQGEVPSTWAERARQVWAVQVGEGHSTPVLDGDRIYLLTRLGDNEVIHALDRKTGKKIWQNQYPAPYEMNDAARGHGKGPKSTPTLADGRLITLGISGILSCIDTRTGKPVWRKEFAKRYAKTSPLYGAATSPLVVGSRCIAHVGGHDHGGLIAFDVATGKELWAYEEDGPGYASPIVTRLGDRDVVITQTQGHLVAVDLARGMGVWKKPFTTEYDQNSVTPVMYQDVLIYSGTRQPTTAVKLEWRDGAIADTEVWTNADIPMYMSTPVLSGKLLFGMTERRDGQLFCAEVASGKLRWTNKGRMGENVALVLAGEYLLLLTNSARLIVAKVSGDRYEPLRDYRVAETPTWAHPVLTGGQVLIKDLDHLRLWQC